MGEKKDMKYCIQVIDPDDGEEMYVRNGIVPGEGPIVQYDSREEARSQVSFMKLGMEQGEDYESISVIPYRKEYEP